MNDEQTPKAATNAFAYKKNDTISTIKSGSGIPRYETPRNDLTATKDPVIEMDKLINMFIKEMDSADEDSNRHKKDIEEMDLNLVEEELN